MQSPVPYLHEEVGKGSVVDPGGSQWRSQMLQARRLEPARHDGVASIAARRPLMIIQRGRGGIALLHLAAHVALLRPALRRQFSSFEENRCQTNKKNKFSQLSHTKEP